MRLPAVALCTLALCGCATAIDTDANPVLIVAHTPGNPDCSAIGDVRGHQGNWFTGPLTPDADIELGARNDLKNKTHAASGNVVVLSADQSTKVKWVGDVSVSYSGQAFKCPGWN